MKAVAKAGAAIRGEVLLTLVQLRRLAAPRRLKTLVPSHQPGTDHVRRALRNPRDESPVLAGRTGSVNYQLTVATTTLPRLTRDGVRAPCVAGRRQRPWRGTPRPGRAAEGAMRARGPARCLPGPGPPVPGGPLGSWAVRADMGARVRAGAQSALGQYDRTVFGPGTPATERRGRAVCVADGARHRAIR
ncbi:hypothetical protein [Streptomyces sp. NPDC056544]|uniref:hypothetical protein n=1 Tax=unclassified Streptomyces TaxID=2593676 RepID=UPI00367D6860